MPDDTFSKIAKELGDLENSAAETGAKFSVEKVQSSIAELKADFQRLSNLQNNLESVRKEILLPVINELATSTRHSKISFWIGFFLTCVGLYLTVAALYPNYLLPDFLRPEVQLVKEITPAEPCMPNINLPLDASALVVSMANNIRFISQEAIGLNSTSKLNKGVHRLTQGEQLATQDSKYGAASLKLMETDEKELLESRKLFRTTRFQLKLGERVVMSSGLQEMVNFTNKSGIAAIQGDMILLGQGDSVRIGNGPNIKVVKISRTESRLVPLADDENAAYLEEVINSHVED